MLGRQLLVLLSKYFGHATYIHAILRLLSACNSMLVSRSSITLFLFLLGFEDEFSESEDVVLHLDTFRSSYDSAFFGDK